MPVELRKRKPREEPAPPPARKRNSKAAKVVDKVKEVLTGTKADKEPEPKKEEKVEEEKVDPAPVDEAPAKAVAEKKAPAGKVAVGDTIDLEGFGGEIETNDGKKTTLKALVEESKAGVVLFTYPKASTPGCKFTSQFHTSHSLSRRKGIARSCIKRLSLTRRPTLPGTTQACLFRDSYTPLTAEGLAIYGLSTDSPKANTNFKERQKLQYPLLCDPTSTLIGAIGLKKVGNKTQRGVFVVDKQGKVLLAEAGGPAATVDAVKKLVEAGKA
jgi:peroxiredoxin Q/BCP